MHAVGDAQLFLTQLLVNITEVIVEHLVGDEESKPAAMSSAYVDTGAKSAPASIGPERYLPFNHIYECDAMVKELEAHRPVGAPTGLVARDFFDAFFNIMFKLICDRGVWRVYITGTPGIGKSWFRNYAAWRIIHLFLDNG